MLVFDLRTVGEKFYKIRKSKGLSRADVAELADLSDRTYADIERGTVNMRIETALRICSALNITPDEVFTLEKSDYMIEKEQLLERISFCNAKETETILKLVSLYLDSINK